MLNYMTNFILQLYNDNSELPVFTHQENNKTYFRMIYDDFNLKYPLKLIGLWV